MHEFSLISSVADSLDNISTERKIKRINVVGLDVGRMLHIEEDVLKYAFSVVAEGKTYEDAEMEINYIEIEMHCNSCSEEFIVNDMIFLCPKCGSSNLKTLKGKEFVLAYIDID